ncbi:DNA methyltransferase [Salipiger aestuarii]|uniref:16S rRNA (Guanine966-N2)-methyltransferase n=1 Tax=Salipiger aestuarii TaxID=568098 RepID=A0A327Y4S7_9RHOB|nr:16S rRNA (guanine(966)-N(2))-methyltransferase RsmD [Salipiger aestuarii]EIE49744.1 methyltransferase, putative [Citreicella sp. 357]KAA8607650.1 DNA methyltransferase [Salipiger aestuarii]KAA8611111.1 DNA methyltransferase [Salipiger aestuarii]KAB2541877.1 DNA methyltransferase [Salipiger aestuarii]RAK15401.1 16S rRNA (guanine966-N2)-methyltransferase [Salipiger aestuarii]
MRIIAGTWRGRALTPVGKGDPRAHLRPTTDRTRESLFNMLAGGRFGDPFTAATVLDLFAGTGALGLEALSRGAQSCTFVDDGRKAQSLLRENIRLLDCAGRTRLIARDATRLPTAETPATLVFLDPPYGKALGVKALHAASLGGWLAAGSLIVWEENAPQPAPDGFELLDSRRYGDTHVTMLTAP